VPEKKTTPEDKIIAMTKGAKGVSKEHRPGAVARPSVRSDGPRALMAKKSNEPGEREKSEGNLDYLQVSYRADMIAIVLVIATVFESSAKKHQMAAVCQFCSYVFVSAVIESRWPTAFPRTRHSSIL
jgi:Na+/glutamate symporter